MRPEDVMGWGGVGPGLTVSRAVPPQDLQSLVLLTLAAVAVLVVGGWAIHILRRRLKNPDSGGRSRPALTMTEIRAMRDRGEISEKEYQALRHTLAGQFDDSKPPKDGSGD